MSILCVSLFPFFVQSVELLLLCCQGTLTSLGHKYKTSIITYFAFLFENLDLVV